MFIRMVVTAVLFYIVWKIVRAFSARAQQPPRKNRSARPGAKKDFSDIQDAEFEDITPKDSDPKPKP
jgi:hypothetical protein